MENLILLSKDDLRSVFKEWAAEVAPEKDDELLTTEGLAQYLGYSVEWVRQSSSKVKRGKTSDFPPFFKRGRKLLFRKSDVDSWIEGRRQP